MDVKWTQRSFGYGLLLTSFAALLSSAVAFWGYRNIYYLAEMLPVFMVFYLLLAWLIYLRKTAFLLHDRPEMPGAELVLVWSACQLALLAAILYYSFGVGTKYF